MSHHNERKGFFSKIPKWLITLIKFGIFTGVMCVGVFVAWALLVTLPAINSFQNRVVSESTKIFDRTGSVLLYDVHGSIRRTQVPIENISPFIRNAAVAIEDATFYQHHGFRPLSFMRAVLANITTGSYGQGGSTITQQVVKNTLLTQDKTPIRKAKEIILAMKLERVATKDQILNIYLNETSYGGTLYGVEEASNYFFGKSAKDVSLAEAAYLAALPQAPTRYSPYGSHRNELEKRKNLVLSRMKLLGYITEDQYNTAMAEQVQFRAESEAGIKAPHFVFYIREQLEEKYGADAVANGGLKVITTLDYDLQKKAEETVSKFAPNMMKNFGASNESMVAVEPKTGQILAMVGSKDYFDDSIDGQVNVAISNRQPGSSFKPFVYATAFQKGYTPSTVVFDVQTQFSTSCSPSDVANSEAPCYSPQNYDGAFHGPMTLRDALAQSMNIPAVKTLYLAGIKDSLHTASELGITTLGDSNRYGLTLVLGGGEVNLLEMTGAYSVFANDGVKNPIAGIMRVEDHKGEVLDEYKESSSRVLDQEVVRQLNDVLSDNVARIPEFGADSPLNFPGHKVADKTGTTNDFHDVWILGYTPGIAVGAWAGNNNNKAMERKIAAFIIAPMWHEFMEYALTKYPSDNFPPPAPIADYDSLPSVLKGNWNTDPAQGIHDILYWVDKDNPRSGAFGNRGDSQYQYWEYPVSLWANQNPSMIIGSTTGPVIPGLPTGNTNPGFTIAYPGGGTVVPWGLPFQTWMTYQASLGITNVSYYLNGAFVGVSSQPPFTVAIQPSSHGTAVLKAVGETASGKIEATTNFTVQ